MTGKLAQLLIRTDYLYGLFQKGIIESGVYEAKVYQKEDGDGTAIVKALLKELNLDESEVEKLETIPYYELSNAYNKVEAEVAAKGCYIGQGPMENGWFRGNPIKCGCAIVPFMDNFPKNRLYRLMTTKLSETSAA